MVTFIARLRILPGKEAEAVAHLKEMVAAVEANEPGARAYCCHQSEQDAAEVVFYEVYADDPAKEAHMMTPHFEKLCGLIGQVFEADFGVQVEDLRSVAGFCRTVRG